MLPFHSVRTIDKPHEGINQNDSTFTEAANEYLEALTSRANQLKVVHINMQSMVSSFDELILMIKEYPYDVITMSETWLKNNPHLLNYVTIPGYSNTFRNRDDIRGGGVGVDLKDAIDFKRRTDIESIEPELEHISLEIPGRNKHSKLLLGVMYRSERMQNFETWMDKTENLFSQLNTLWDDLTVILTWIFLDQSVLRSGATLICWSL